MKYRKNTVKQTKNKKVPPQTPLPNDPDIFTEQLQDELLFEQHVKKELQITDENADDNPPA